MRNGERAVSEAFYAAQSCITVAITHEWHDGCDLLILATYRPVDEPEVVHRYGGEDVFVPDARVPVAVAR